MTVSNFDELLDFKYLIYQSPDVWRVDNTIHWITPYPLDSALCSVNL